jgi:NADPH-dependent 2,4-dienoyl-CoA reductase/sulfur reductase-like enzyme
MGDFERNRMHTVILGNGITGVSAATRLRQLDPQREITIISGESDFHYSRPALMYIFMGHMRYQDTKPYPDSFWDEQRLRRVRDWVVGIDTDARTLRLHRGEAMSFDQLLVATGSKSNRFGWPGQDLPGAQGLYDLMDLRLLYENTRAAKHAVIVGGGLIGIELAEMLHSRNIHVTFVVREQSYWDNVLPPEESQMLNRIIREAGMELMLETNLKEIHAGSDGRVAAIETDDGQRIDCEMVGLTAGVSPNVDLVRSSAIDVGRGILVDDSFRSSVDGVLAAGDCAEIVSEGDGPNLLQQVWYSGKAQGRVAGEVLAGRPARYDPGTWYNSAKFLDLEYQTYGRVGFHVEGERSVYWEHASHRHAMRIVHVDDVVIGMNLMGLRYRHRRCAKWIEEARSVNYVLDHLSDGNFDPEFFVHHEDEIRGQLAAQFRASGQGAVA